MKSARRTRSTQLSRSRQCVRGSLAALVSLGVLAVPGAGLQAQDNANEFAILAVAHRAEGEGELLAIVKRVDAELARRHVAHVTPDEARELVLAHHSRDPVAFADREADQFVQRARAGNEALTRGDMRAALEALRSALSEAERAIESVNRRPDTAQHFWDACLLTVRAYQQNGDTAQARMQARQCRAMSPTMQLAPTDNRFPKFVHDLVAEADAAIAGERLPPIVVTSAPPGCPVRFNGQLLQATPAALEHPANYPYRVQVECEPGVAGRVHEVRPGAKPLSVDGALEAALTTDHDALILDYRQDGAGQREAVLRDHLRKLVWPTDAVDAPVLNVEQLLIVARTADGRIAIRRIGRGDGNTVYIRDPERELDSALTQVLEPVLETPEPQSTATTAPVPAAAPKKLARWHKALGFTSLALGATAAVTAAWRFRVTHHAGRDLQATTRSAPQFHVKALEWQDARPAPYYWMATSAALLTAGSLGMMLRADRSSVPWWAAGLAGAVGVGLATVGIVDLAKGGVCSGLETTLPNCVDQRERRDRGALLLLASVPALTLFTTKLIVSGNPVTITPQAHRQGMIVLAGMSL